MTERRLLLPAAQHAAVHAGSKTQHRVVLRPQPPARATLDEVKHGIACFFLGEDACSGDRVYRFVDFRIKPGDRLWLPEAWARAWELDGDGEPAGEELTYYRADGEPFSAYHMPDGSIRDGIPWRSPATMPKWAARIWLTVTEVRVQRLQDISEEDARAEGARPAFTRTTQPDWPVVSQPSYVWGLEELWNSIHGPGAFERNDWVAAYTFERAQP